MSRLYAFTPGYGHGQVIATSTLSSATPLGVNSRAMVVTNQDATDGVYVETGSSSAVAATTSYYVPPNGQVALTKADTHTHIAAIAVANTPSIHVIPGEGL